MSTAKYIPLSLGSKTYDELVDILRQSFKDACVLYIDRIVNPVLLSAFETRKSLFIAEGTDPNERRLFHGTKSESVNSICNFGYKSEFNKVSAYGKGTYFAAAGSYSKNYADVTGNGESFMLVNRVLLGRNTISNSTDFTSDSGGDGKTVFVTKYDDASLPEYVICFHKKAQI